MSIIHVSEKDYKHIERIVGKETLMKYEKKTEAPVEATSDVVCAINALHNEDLIKNCLISLKDFANENHQYSDEEREALEQKALSDGEIVEPLIVWKEKRILVWGHAELEIAQKHSMRYTTKELSFGTKADCLAWIAEKRMSIPSLPLFRKIEIGKRFADYWLSKTKGDKNNPLCNAALHRFGETDQLAIIAIKAGTSRNTVGKVNRILESKNKDMIEECRTGELSINAANKRMKGGDQKPPAKDSPNEMPESGQKEAQERQKTKEKEVRILATYYVKGFSATQEKLDDHGLKFFVLRWNEENPDNQIEMNEVQKEISDYENEKE